MNYYNEFDPRAAEWLRQLIHEKAIPNGHVDTRSIKEVSHSDLTGYHQCHFFAGIGGWPYALQLAGFDGHCWTGSCPCQPFSTAGKQKGEADDRHLWPEFRRLIAECRPPTVFGEQVASRLGREWLAGVRADLEGVGYAVGAADLCAAGVAAPHLRQRLYWVADVQQQGLEGYARHVDDGREPGWDSAGSSGPAPASGSTGGVAHTDGGDSSSERIQRSREHGLLSEDSRSSGVGDTVQQRLEESPQRDCESENRSADRHPQRADPDRPNFWSRYDLVPCRDGKTRRFEPESFPLAPRVPGRVGLLRGYGNAIVPQVAATFVKAFSQTAQA